jgi:hypothetical protein
VTSISIEVSTIELSWDDLDEVPSSLVEQRKEFVEKPRRV